MAAVRTLFLEGVAMPLVALLAAPTTKHDWTREPDVPVLIVSNHVTLYDVPILLYGLGRRTRRRVAVAMAGEMLLNWRRANWSTGYEGATIGRRRDPKACLSLPIS